MFMGPYEGNVEWSTRTIQGVKRFVSKYYTFLNDAYEKKVPESSREVKVGVERLLERVENNILDFKFNTAIAALMEFYNSFSKSSFDIKDLEKIILISAPIFPHIAEEISSTTMGKSYSVHDQKWPKINKSLLVEDNIEIPVQINGKVRGTITIPKSSTQEQVQELVLKSDTLGRHLSGVYIEKFIYVPQRIVSIIL